MNRKRRTLLKTATAAALATGILTACAPTAEDLKPAVAEKLQQRVQTLAESAAQKDFNRARNELDLLAADLAPAIANGEVSPARAQAIQNAVELVRADLTSLTPSRTATPQPAVPGEPPVQSPGNSGKGKGKDK